MEIIALVSVYALVGIVIIWGLVEDLISDYE